MSDRRRLALVAATVTAVAACHGGERRPAAVAGGELGAPSALPSPIAPGWRRLGDLEVTLDRPPLSHADGDPMRAMSIVTDATPTALVDSFSLGTERVGVLRLHVAGAGCDAKLRWDLDHQLVPDDVRHGIDDVFEDGWVHTRVTDLPADGFHEGLPWDAMAALHHDRTRAVVWIDRARRWVDVTADLAIGAGGRVLIQTAPIHGTPVEVSQDGRPLTWTVWGRWLTVDLPRAGTVRIRIQGEPVGAYDWMRPEVARLRELVPVVPGNRPELDVTIHVPDGDRVEARLPAEPAPSATGWRAWRIRGRSDRVDAVILADGGAPRTIDRGGARWTVSGPPALDRAIEQAVDALAPLGPPAGARVIGYPLASDVLPRVPSVGADPAVVVSWSGLDPALDLHTVTATLAGAWLGRAPDAIHQPCPWQDAAVMAVGLWALDDAGAHAMRRRWAQAAGRETWFRLGYPGPADERRVGMCARGALVFAELERRLGRDAFALVLRDLRATPARAGWSDVADALAHRGHADDESWLRGWIDRPIPLDLGLHDVTRTAGAIDGYLLQAPLVWNHECPDFDQAVRLTDPQLAIAPYHGPVTIAAMAGAREVARIEVQAGVVVTPVHFDDDPAITSLVVDPDQRLPIWAGPTLAVEVPPRAAAPP